MESATNFARGDLTSRRDRSTWVKLEPFTASSLQLLNNGSYLEDVQHQQYFVQQLPGAGLGYEVVLFDASSMERPSFEGYQIELDQRNIRYRVALIGESGDPIPGSERSVRVLFTDRAWAAYGLSGLPFIVGMLVARAASSSASSI